MKEKKIDNPLISVVVPVYKAEDCLKNCINSLVNQTYENCEIILIDDGSPDLCPKICDDFATRDNRIVVIHKKNGGVSAARNTGIENATGDYILFVDADDFLEKDCLESFVNYANETDSDLIMSDYYSYTVDGQKIPHKNKFPDKFLKKDFTVFFGNMNNVHRSIWAVLFKKNLIQNLRFDEEVKIAEDFLFLIQSLKLSNCPGYLNKCLYNYFQNTNSVTKNRNKKFYENTIVGIGKCKAEFANNDTLTRCLNYELYIDACSIKVLFNDDFYFEQYKQFNTKCNYREFTRYGANLKSKIKAFLCRHKMFHILKLLLNR